MANENKKDFNAMLADNKDMPKIKIITDEKSIEKYGGSRMYFAPPANYDTVMKQVPEGKLITVGMLRDFFARKAGADFTDPITAGIFVSIAAWASEQREDNKTPWHRTLKADGELNPKYPGGFTLVSSDSADYPYILCGRRILRSQDMSLKKLGTVVVALNVGKLLDNEIHRLSSKPSELYLYNCQTLVYHSGKAADAVVLPDSAQGYKIQTLSGKKKFICWQTSSLTGLRLCSVFDYHEIYGQINAARNALIFGECAILLLFAWVLLHMARLVTKPIHTLGEAVQTVDQQEGNFAAARALLPKDISADEIGTLTKEFDSMLGKIDTLIHENYEKQILLQETRYKMLQAQINPHFLYNTLGTLNWLVKAGNREDACKMIVSLGDILRAALSPRQNSTAAADVQLAGSYIAIQQLRYKSRAEFTLTASGELEQWSLPHFTLQPLVENAIHYGVEDSDEVCKIDVIVQAEDDTLTLIVHNTGKPVKPEKLTKIRTFTVKPQGHGIGLKNIYERLSMLYKAFGFDFDSDESGTTVKIVLKQENLAVSEDISDTSTALPQ